MKELIIGQIPKDYKPNNHIILGPFCLSERRETYKYLEKINFIEDPFNSPEELRAADELTAKFAKNFLMSNFNQFNSQYNVSYSYNYWSIIYLPWVFALTQLIWERQARINSAIKKWGDIPLKVNLVKDNIPWLFIDTLDFQKSGTMNLLFNEWLFSRIIEKLKPDCWEVTIIDKSNFYQQKEISHISANRIFNLDKIRRLATCDGVYGLNLIENLLFSFILAIRPISKRPISQSTVKNLTLENLDSFELNYDFNKYFQQLMPLSIREIDFNYFETKTKHKKIYITSASIIFNDKIKPLLATASEKGSIIISSQHGGHPYGVSSTYQQANLIEYCQRAFITWGWKQHNNYKGNFINLPQPYLSKIRNRHKKTNDNLIYVSTLPRLYSHRLQSTPQPVRQIEYLRDKRRFLDTINKNIFLHLLYRYYPSRVGAVDDKYYIHNYFPKIQYCDGNLDNQMFNCKLLVLDHLGTTINKAVGANIPFVGFWNLNDSPVSEDVLPFFKQLIEVKILFNSAKDAATHINSIWDDIDNWWNDKDVQNAKREWGEKFAKSSVSWRREWIKFLWKV